MNAISLFSSGGIGDLGLKANNINTIINCELLEKRMEIFSANYPESKNFLGDIWELKNDIVNYYKENFTEDLFMVLATPPCQGMSSNGAGKLLHEYRKGLRPKLDERNRLIIPTLDIICELKPQWVIFENVPQMRNTVIMDENDQLINVIDYIGRRLGSEYVGKAEVVEVANYGVPQSRKRLITIYTKTLNGKEYFKTFNSFIPPSTHSQNGDNGKNPWVTLRDAISHLPALDSKKGKNYLSNYNELHETNILTEEKYFWVEHTKEGDTAFNNQCINPECLYQDNQKHGTKINKEGINKFNTDTPLYCEKCGSLLPRPYTIDKKTNEKRIMKGYTSAYKRMKWDDPASTITQNFQYACSDNKIHPEQNRVLSIYEAMILQTIANYDYTFKRNGKLMGKGVIRDIIGESVPPKLIDCICKNILFIKNSEMPFKVDEKKERYEQLTLI